MYAHQKIPKEEEEENVAMVEDYHVVGIIVISVTSILFASIVLSAVYYR